MYNIIGDVAGRYEELMLLIAKMPKGEVILLGDLNDRGPDSNKVIQWAIDNKIRCVKSNHGDMLIGHYNGHHDTTYETIRDWDTSRYSYIHNTNGGHQTLLSYGGIANVPKEHIEYLVNLPWYIRENGLFLSHAPWHPDYDDLKDVTDLDDTDISLMWNRELPKPRTDYQVHGHNSMHEVYRQDIPYMGEYDYGMCIDDCHNNQLMGMHWPTKELFTQEYL